WTAATTAPAWRRTSAPGVRCWPPGACCAATTPTTGASRKCSTGTCRAGSTPPAACGTGAPGPERWPVALTDLSTVKTFLQVASTDTTQDALLTQLVTAADKVVRKFCKRELETAGYTQYASGNGLQQLPLRQRPVRIQTFTGTTSSGSAVVTGISSTAT